MKEKPKTQTNIYDENMNIEKKSNNKTLVQRTL